MHGGQVSGHNRDQHHIANEHGGHTDSHQGTEQLHLERLCQLADARFLIHRSFRKYKTLFSLRHKFAIYDVF